jgi:methyl-accepting chemotaxis protein
VLPFELTNLRSTSILAGEITSASIEQSTGIAQVGEAVAQMDQVTQQNAALVEQSAAAAESLRSQAQEMVQTVAVFKLDNEMSPRRSPVTSHY